MSFTKFPDFQPFSLKDKDDYLKYYSQLDAPYCDFSLDDLCIWLNYNNDLEVCELNDNLILRFSNIIDGNRLYYTLLGTSNLKATIDTLRQFLKDNSQKFRLYYISEQLASLLKDYDVPHLKIKEDIDNKDYVYSVQDSLALQGKPYQNLRTRINHFVKENNNIKVKEFDLTDHNERLFIEMMISKWKDQPGFPDNDPEDWETHTLSTHFQLVADLPVHAFGIYTNDKLVSVVIFNLPPHKEWLICNHIKYDHTYKDIYGYAFYALCKVAEARGIKWVNLEQDAGIEGLRRIKMLFRPAAFLKRYIISLNHDTKAQ